MPYTQQDLAALQAELLTTEKRVRDASGREVEGRSIADIQAAINEVRADLAIQSGNGVPRTTFAAFTRD